jgi:hypothetical protein
MKTCLVLIFKYYCHGQCMYCVPVAEGVVSLCLKVLWLGCGW